MDYFLRMNSIDSIILFNIKHLLNNLTQTLESLDFFFFFSIGYQTSFSIITHTFFLFFNILKYTFTFLLLFCSKKNVKYISLPTLFSIVF